MRRSLWLVLAVVLWQFAKSTISAFSTPWVWTVDQFLFLFFVAAAVLVAAQWLFVYVKGGSTAIKQHRAMFKERWSKPTNPKVYRWSLIFWITVAIGLVVLFNATRAVSNFFVIKDPEDAISSAELRLCGRRLQLTKFTGEYRGELPITCEGDGDILVQLSNGHKAECGIGYVTPGAEQRFQFTIEDGSCR